MRIGLALLVWSRWAGELVPYRELGPQAWLVGLSFFASTTLLLIGLWSRVAAAWASATLVYMFVGIGEYQGRESWTHHHTTLLVFATCLLALVPCGGSFSVDRWWAVRQADRRGESRPAERGPLWAVPLFGVLVSAVYFWGAYDKTAWAFLSGERMQHHLMGLYLGSDPLLPWEKAAMFAAALATVVGEYTLAFSFWIRRLRAASILTGLVLHFLFYALIPVGTFSLTMVLLYVAYLDQDALHAWIDDHLAAAPRTS